MKINKRSLWNDFYPKNDEIKMIQFNSSMCSDCDVEMFIEESYFTCPYCGQMQMYIGNDQLDTNPETYTLKSNYYKPSAHFKKILMSFQGIKPHKFKSDFIEEIRAEIQKQQIPYDQLNYCKMRKILHHLNHKNKYEHIPYILSYFDHPLPNLPYEITDRLQYMFSVVNGTYAKINNTKRLHFFNYYYVLHQLLKLVDYAHLCHSIPLMKNQSKIQFQDMLWKKICDELKWDYYPVV